MTDEWCVGFSSLRRRGSRTTHARADTQPRPQRSLNIFGCLGPCVGELFTYDRIAQRNLVFPARRIYKERDGRRGTERRRPRVRVGKTTGEGVSERVSCVSAGPPRPARRLLLQEDLL